MAPNRNCGAIVENSKNMIGIEHLNSSSGTAQDLTALLALAKERMLSGWGTLEFCIEKTLTMDKYGIWKARDLPTETR